MGIATEGKSIILSAQPVVDTAIYASGDQLGSLVEITNAFDDASGTGTIVSVVVADKAAQNAVLSIMLFNDRPTITSTDNAALSISDAEMASKFVGSIPVAAADYVGVSVGSAATVRNVMLLVNSRKSETNLTGRSLWMLLRSGGTPTYTSTSDLVLKIAMKQD